MIYTRRAISTLVVATAWLAFWQALLPSTLQACTVHPLFADQMVIQRDQAIAIYGKGDEGEKVTVEFAGQSGATTVVNGKWMVSLKGMAAGGPYSMKIASEKNEINLQDILMGDVWILGGQSNMSTGINHYRTKENGRYAKLMEDTQTYTNKNIRMFKQLLAGAEERKDEPRMDGAWKGYWKELNPENSDLSDFSATGYYFAKALQENIHVPIGLLFACAGSTPAETWVPKEVLTSNPLFADIVAKYQKALDDFPKALIEHEQAVAIWKEQKKAGVKNLKDPPGYPMNAKHWARPCGLFYGMVAPLTRSAVKGVIWYQGENNTSTYERAIQYRELFKAVITNWRMEFKSPNMPFYFCQLAAFKPASKQVEDSNWSYLREAQGFALSLPNTGMANLIDAGFEWDIHPAFKHEAGERLAALVRNQVYGQKIVSSGPTFAKLKIDGPKATITFAGCGSGLEAKDVTLGWTHHLPADELRGFTVCSNDQVFVGAKARIDNNQVVVTHPDGKNIVAVRYAWANFPLVNLYNKEGFPAYPFRTDNFTPKLAVDPK